MNFVFFFFIFFLTSINAFSADCSSISEKIELKDIILKVSKDGVLKASFKNYIAQAHINLNATAVKDSKIPANIQLKNIQGEICKTINVEVDPALLCRDANGAIEPWTYWVYKPTAESIPEYSIVSTRTNFDEEVFMRNSRVCGYSTFLGHVVIENSNIESTASSRSAQSEIKANGLVHIIDSEVKGKFLFEDLSSGTGEIILRDTSIDGNPEIKSLTNRIFLGDVDITGNPKI